MRAIWVATAAAVLVANSLGWGQHQQIAAPGQAQTPTAAAILPTEIDQKKEINRTLKQKLLDDQAQRLVAMASELKSAVDKTNKNILSLDVVRKAEQIELLAHKMKDEGKR